VINAGELALSAAVEATAFGDAATAKEKYEVGILRMWGVGCKLYASSRMIRAGPF